MCTQEPWQLHCTSQWDSRRPLIEYVYYVAVTFKMTEQGEQRICIQFCTKPEHSSMETIWMILKATAMGCWWLTTSSWQCAHSRITSWANFLVKHQIIQVAQPCYSPHLVPCDFCLFPKLKSPLKGKRFHVVDKIQENTTGQRMAIGRTVWGPKYLLWRGLRHHYPMYNVSCILYLLQ